VARKLQLYNDVRYKQAVTVLFMSRVGDEHRDAVMGDLRKYVPDAELPENMWTFAWTSFPVREANRLLVEQA
jgi:salicylate hydroxylase